MRTQLCDWLWAGAALLMEGVVADVEDSGKRRAVDIATTESLDATPVKDEAVTLVDLPDEVLGRVLTFVTIRGKVCRRWEHVKLMRKSATQQAVPWLGPQNVDADSRMFCWCSHSGPRAVCASAHEKRQPWRGFEQRRGAGTLRCEQLKVSLSLCALLILHTESELGTL